MNEILITFQKVFFHFLYHQLAWAYDAVAWIVSAGHWQEWCSCVLNYLQGKNILELGQGHGHLLDQLNQKGFYCTGIDSSPQMCEIASRRGNGRLSSRRIVRGKAEALPFQDSFFDSVFATFPTEYIFIPDTLKEVNRILRKSGKFIILLGVNIEPGNIYEQFLKRLYSITRQGVPDNSFLDGFLMRINQSGLEGNTIILSWKNYQLLFIECQKN